MIDKRLMARGDLGENGRRNARQIRSSSSACSGPDLVIEVFGDRVRIDPGSLREGTVSRRRRMTFRIRSTISSWACSLSASFAPERAVASDGSRRVVEVGEQGFSASVATWRALPFSEYMWAAAGDFVHENRKKIVILLRFPDVAILPPPRRNSQ